MTYFKRVKSLADLKKQYRTLAKENHPDMGGNEKVMVAINNEFDTLFPVWKSREPLSTDEKSYQYRSEFYTQNGWKGKNYSRDLDTKEIARRIRVYVKQVFPLYKFSVSFSSYAGGSSIHVSLMEAPMNILDEKEICDTLNDDFEKENDTRKYKAKYYKNMIDEDNINFDLSYYHVSELGKDFIIPEATRVLKDVVDQLNSYRRDDSDAMIDYFDTNFYIHLGVGKYGKPFKVVKKELKKNKKAVAVKE